MYYTHVLESMLQTNYIFKKLHAAYNLTRVVKKEHLSFINKIICESTDLLAELHAAETNFFPAAVKFYDMLTDHTLSTERKIPDITGVVKTILYASFTN